MTTCMTPEVSRKCPVRNGLRDISMEEFWRNPLIVCETLEHKLQGLPVARARYPVFDVQIVEVLHLLRAVALRTYGEVSMLAVTDLLSAVDYFLLLRDERDDNRSDGYDDDAAKLRDVFAKHAGELAVFRRWFASGS